MRILLTADPELPVPPPLYGGIERIVDWLLRHLRQRGHQVGLIAHRDSTVQADEFFPWPGLQSQRSTDIVKNTMHLANAARRYRPDVIHSFSRVAYLLPLAFSRTPKIMSFQRYPGARSVGLGQKLCGRSLSFTGCSEYIAALGRKGGGNFISIHNGVELDRYTFRPTVANDAPLVYLSRLDKVKGAGLAIKVARRAGVPLVLAGNVASSGPDLDYFKREVEPHFGNGVEYVGPVNDQQKNDLLGRARAMLVPIQWDEPFGIVFVEALACGTPVISSPNGALPEIITEGRDGYLTRDEDALVEAIGKVHLLDRAACRRKVEEHFTAEIITTKYEQLYQAQLALR